LLSIVLIRLMTIAFPQFGHYATDLQTNAPTLDNWSGFFVYQLWECPFYGGLLVAARIFTLRVERSGHLLHQSAAGRSRTEALLDEARLQALQLQIDPNLLLESMKELEQRYRANPQRAERLLEVLVEFLRCAMPGLQVPVSTLDAELQLARAYSHLQHERGVNGAWRIVEDPRVEDPGRRGAPLKFPRLLMLRLLALGGEGGQPTLQVGAEGGQTVLSLHGLSLGISAEFSQQIRTRLQALYGEGFGVESEAPEPRQLRISLQAGSILSG
jgi:hypothetical protein